MNVREHIRLNTPKREHQASNAQKSEFSPSTNSPVDQILHLQRTIGNRAVQQLIKSGSIQAKLKIGQPNTIYEQQADKVADLVIQGKSAEQVLGRVFSHSSDSVPMLVQREQPKYTNEDKKRCLAVFNKSYSKLYAADSEPDTTKKSLNAFLSMLYFATSSTYTTFKSEANVNMAAYLAALEEFRDVRGNEVIAKLVAKPAAGIKIWVAKLKRSTVIHKKIGRPFRDKAEAKLVSATASAAAKRAIASSGLSATQIKSLADVQVRAIINQHRTDFFAAASNGVHLWTMPIVPAAKWPHVISGGSALAGGIGSIMTATVAAAGIVSTCGIGLLVAGIGLGIASAIASYSREQDAVKQKKVEKELKEETISGFEKIAQGIRNYQDVLAILCTTEALKEGIDVMSLTRRKLRNFIWKKLFPTFPYGLTAVRKHVKSLMSANLDKHLK